MAFPTWAEEYRAAPEPIDREAFLYRRIQRGITQAALARGGGITARQSVAFGFARRGIADTAAHAARLADPVLAAQLFLQRRGYVVVRASVIDPAARGWRVGGRDRPLSDDELIALAAARGLHP